MQKLTFGSIAKILDRKTRRRLLTLAWARVGANVLDLIGLAGIALLATSFSDLVSGSANRAPLVVPLIGEVLITERYAILIAMGVAAVFIAKSFFSIWLNLLTAVTVARLEAGFSSELAEEFFAPKANLEATNESVADFQNLALNSTGAISAFLNARMSFIAEASLSTLMIAVFLTINPVATLSLLAYLGMVIYGLNRLIGYRIVRNGQLAMAGSQASLESTRDLFGVKREALSSGVIPRWIEKFTASRTLSAEAGAVSFTLNSLPRYVIETSLVVSIFMFMGGVVIFSDLASQALTIGVFMAGGLRLVASLLPLQSAFNAMQDGSARGQLAFEGLVKRRRTLKNKPIRAVVSIEQSPKLKFEQVVLRFANSTEAVLREITFEVEPLTKVAIVGRSGAGKSTIFDLATGFIEPSSGSVTFGGVHARDILFGAPGTFGIVTQRPQLVTGSILENVSLEADDVTDQLRVEQALVRAGLGSLTQHDHWYHHRIQPDSGQLSGGEIQRLGLARALYREPKIIFLDEATSALDAETEAEVTNVLQSLKNQMTVVLIAHRLSTVQHADKIIYLDAGKVVAEGSFSYLKANVPEFAKAVSLMTLAPSDSE